MPHRVPRVVFIAFSEYWSRFQAEGIKRWAGDRFETSWIARGHRYAGVPRFLSRISRADIAVKVGVSLNLSSPLDRFFVHARRFVKTQPVLFWTGSDVLRYLTAFESGTLDTKTLEVLRTLPSLAGAPRLKDELARMGVDATLVYHPVPEHSFPDSTPPLPDVFRVLTYIPAGDKERFRFYGGPTIFEAARDLPNIEFRVCGTTRVPIDCPPNVSLVGRVSDMASQYHDCVAVVRLVKHDAIGGTVIEGLLNARWIIYSYEQPHATLVALDDAVTLAAKLRDLKARFDEGTLGTNDAGRSWAVERYDPAQRFGAYADALQEILSRARETPGGHT